MSGVHFPAQLPLGIFFRQKMEDWLYYSLSITLCLLLSNLWCRRVTGKKPFLPPGPTSLTAFGPLLLLAWTSVNIESVVRVARSWYGPVFTLYLLPSFPVVFVADRAAAHRVLVQRGSAFADRPPANLATRIFSSDQHNITTAGYGPLWRTLRRNLTGKALHPSSIPRYAAARRRAASGLVDGIKRQMRGKGVVVIEGLLHEAAFHVLTCMCFGQGLDEVAIAAVTKLQREFLKAVVFGSSPKVTKLLFWRRYQRMLSMRRRHEEVFIPLIRARRARRDADGESFAMDCYVDSLLDLRIPEDGGSRNLTDGEIVALCTEFLSGPADSTVNVMQWAMANVVARPEIQAKLRTEIRNVVGAGQQVLREDHLPRMPYLRAVVLESLRRHPPARFILPHAAAGEEGEALDGFTVPREVSVNFTMGDMAMDEKVWPDPTRFRPERFLPGGEGEDLDLTGSKEIKMTPFGAGRRMCPGVDVSLLHVMLLVATMVSSFEWSEMPGEPVDFTDTLELTMVMKRPLRAMVEPCC